MADLSSLIGKEPTEIMAILHDKYALKFGNYIARLMELEYYAQDDPFTHGNEKQQEMGTFYVHRTGKEKSSSYKAGNYACVDITLGGAGILIRSIQVLELVKDENGRTIHGKIGEIIEGPNNSLREVCSLVQWDYPTLESDLKLIPLDWIRGKAPSRPILGARVGLTLKRAPDAEMEKWAQLLVAPLRSCLYVPKKGKEMFFVSDIERKDIPSRSQDKYRSEFNQGKGEKLSRNMTPLQIAGSLASMT